MIMAVRIGKFDYTILTLVYIAVYTIYNNHSFSLKTEVDDYDNSKGI